MPLQSEIKPFEIVEGACAWYAEEYKSKDNWIVHLSPQHIDELDDAVRKVKHIDKIESITKHDFNLPTLGVLLENVRDEVVWGRGFALIRGVPVHRYNKKEIMIAYWGMGLYWGRACSNNHKGHLIGHVKDIGHDASNPMTRLYATSAAQPIHNDAADIVSLLCLKNAKEGGLSSWCSSISVHNEIVAKHPDLANVLAGEWYMDRKGEVPVGKKPYFMIPVFNYHQGYLSVNYSDNYYLLSQRHAEVPRLTEKHYEAINVFNQIALSDKLRMDYMLQPGEIQILNNHTQLHTRSAFVDWDNPEDKRHLLRLWIAPEKERPLPDAYLEIYGGSVEIGNRGGIRVKDTIEHISFDAE